jgi:internalin A
MLSWFKKAKPPEPAPPKATPAAPAAPIAGPPVPQFRKGEKTPEEIAEERIQEALKKGSSSLYLDGLGLTRIPESIGRLEMLEMLSIYDNPLTSLPEGISRLEKLVSLAAWNIKIAAIPDCLRPLRSLQKVYFSRCQIRVLPAWVSQLSHLTYLRLAGNNLTQLPVELGKVAHLGLLDLSDNELENLPDSLRELPSLERLFLHGNEKLGIPPEVLGPTQDQVIHSKATPANPQAILDYYFRTRGGARPLNEAKLILLGRGEVGKTCVVNRLVRDKFVDTSKTQGIQIEQWTLPLADGPVKLHVWDFGGQEIMHATHQFFLTQRSLYVLVLAGRQGGEDADAEYWLQLIESFGGESPVIVVLNKMGEQPFALDYRGLRAKYPGIREFVSIDCQDRTGIDELRKVVERETAALKDLRASFPATWVSIKDRLASMAERGERFIEYDTYTQICANLGETDAAAQDQLAGYLHALGIALNYKDDPRLYDTHVLSPHWVTNGIYSVLNWPGLEAQRGELRLHDLARMLDAAAYPRGKHLFLLNLMRRFEVCFEYPEDAQGRYLVPQLLGKEQPALAGEFDARECLNFQYHYNLVPEGLLPRFIVRTHALSEPAGRWRTGVVLAFEGNRALVRADAQARKVFISVTGPLEGRRRLLAVIRSDFERIHADIKRLAVTEMVPVPGQPGWVVAYQELCVFERSGVSKVPRVFDGQMIELNVPEMLAGVELKDGPRRPDEPLSRSEGLPVFISYSHRDEGLRAELETHLKLLQRQGLVSLWTDRRIIPGEKWGGQIDRHLESAEIILLLVSADFIASHYCFDIEMNRALERHEAGDAVVVPIILRDTDLKGVNFGHLQPLPKDARPVTLWPNRDSAWKDVATGIRDAVDARRALEHR